MLVDTDVLIWYLRGHPGAAQFLETLPALTLSAATYMELVQGCRNKGELAQLKKDFAIRQAAVLPITEAVSDRAVALVETHSLSNGLQMADALIAATALEHGLPLASANSKHFRTLTGLRLETFLP